MAEKNTNNIEDPGAPKNLFLFFPKFELKLPPIFNLGGKHKVVAEEEQGVEEKASEAHADVVKVAEPKPLTPPSLKTIKVNDLL
ncbi:hypothetical protein Tsubulata_034340 [Turnera subulata]|uniref:Uncharacterized protein n=1 Tax=Turnera subulata TaxID=218843 RepID=A0A9Q0GNV1_9ROSI|nr:hypothetical protein Tsubulata_034340 [Turnera subulata]